MKKRNIVMMCVVIGLLGFVLTGCEIFTPPPTAEITANVTSGPAPLTVSFDVDLEYVNSWVIDYGDGTSGTDLTHTYYEDDDYTATLTATGSGFMCEPPPAIDTVDITVTETPVVEINEITVSSGPYCTNTLIYFAIKAESNYTITQYSLKSSDGDRSNTRSAGFSFSSPGYKLITATVRNQEGAVDEAQRRIYVEDCCDDPCGNGCDNPCDVDFPCGWDNIQARIEPLHDRIEVCEWVTLCAFPEDAPCTPCNITPSGIAPQGIVPACRWEVRWNVQKMCDQGCSATWVTANSELYESRIQGDNERCFRFRPLDDLRFRIGAQLYYNGSPVGDRFYAYRDAHN